MADRETARALGIDDALIEKVSWEPRPASPIEPPSDSEIQEALQVIDALGRRSRETDAP